MKLHVYLEAGKKRTFAAVAEWPGWTRSGSDQASALQALLDYAPRYAKAVRSARLGFQAPADVRGFAVVERLKGDATTEFGTPGRVPAGDKKPVDEAELRRLTSLLKACWRAFDQAAEAAMGQALRAGPRGGGRDLEKIFRHVVEAQHAYVTMSGWKWASKEKDPQAFFGRLGDRSGRRSLEAPSAQNTDRSPNYQEQRKVALQALAASAHGELPVRGPRGGIRWPARYFVRREAWHVLDHAWEIEDRVE